MFLEDLYRSIIPKGVREQLELGMRLKEFKWRLKTTKGKRLYKRKNVSENKGCMDKMPDDMNKEEFIRRIFSQYSSVPQQFGREQFYQSFEPLGIEGKRLSEKRICSYGLKEFFGSEKTVLDIGCNTGFIDLTMAADVYQIHGIEYEANLVQIARETANYMKYRNCEFTVADFNYYKDEKQYDLVFSFAVHEWINMPVRIYSKKIYNLLKEKGVLLIESHNIKPEGYEESFDEYINTFCKKRFQIVRSGYSPDVVERRKFYFLRKV